MARTSRSLRHPRPADAGGAAGDGRARWQLGLAGAAVLVAAADTYVVVLALPAIMADVGLGIDQLQRAAPIVSGFLLGYVVVLPLLGRLSDLYGRRPVLLACLGVFATGSLLTATASGLAMVVAGRTLQGLGGGGVVPVTLAMVADIWPEGRRALPLGAVGAVQELGSVAGPLYGAAIISVSTWRAIFWVNLGLAVAVAGALSLPRPTGRGEDAREGDDAHRRRLPLDRVGIALLGLGALGFILAAVAPDWLASGDATGVLYLPLAPGSLGALTTPLVLGTAAVLLALAAWEVRAGPRVRRVLPLDRLAAVLRDGDWLGALLAAVVLGCVVVAFASADPSVAVAGPQSPWLLGVAAVAVAAFLVHERRTAAPLIDLPAMRAPAAWGALLTNLAVGAALMAALVDIPVFARATRYPDSQVDAALVLVRFLAAVPVGAVLGGVLSRRLPYRVTAAAGLALAAAMFWVMTAWGADSLAQRLVLGGWTTPLPATDPVLVLCGLGFGIAIAPVNAAILAAVRPQLHGVASALVVAARMIGMLAGIAVLTSLGLRAFYAAQAHIPSPTQLCPRTPLTCTPYLRLVTGAAVQEVHAVFVGAAASALAAAVLSATLLRRPGRGAAEPHRRPAAIPAAVSPGDG